MIKIDLVEGQTAPIDVQLMSDGVSAGDMTGMTIALELKGRDGSTVVTTGGKVVWGDITTAVARFNPASTDLKAAKSPYLARWSVTDQLGKVAFWPAGLPDEWNVTLPTV